MATQYSYDSGGGWTESTREYGTIHEDFQNLISVISPMDTPLLSILPTRSVSNILYDWPMDDISQPTGTTAKQEGDPTMTASNTNRTRLVNGLFIDHVTVDVSATQRHMDEAGVDDEFAYQIQKKGLELAKQVEFNLLWQTYLGASTSTTARQTAGLIQWAAQSGIHRAEGTNVTWDPVSQLSPGRMNCDVYGSVWHRCTAGLTESVLNSNVLAESWKIGNDINGSLVFVGDTVKTTMSNFGVVYTQGTEAIEPLTRMTIAAELRKRAISIDTFQGDFGTFMVVLNRYMTGTNTQTIDRPLATANYTVTANTTLLGFDPNFVRLAMLRPIQYHPLAKTGDFDRGFIVCELGLQVDNPKALFGASEC